MDSSKVASIESALSGKLPKGYRKFLINRAAEVEELKELHSYLLLVASYMSTAKSELEARKEVNK